MDTGLITLLEGYDSPFNAHEEDDQLQGRFTISLHQPLPELSHPLAEAYAAHDKFTPTRQLVAMVLPNTVSHRHLAVQGLVGFQHPNFACMLAAGTIRLSNVKEWRLVLFFERPVGQKLSTVLATGKRFNELQILDNVLSPLCEILLGLRDRKLSHGLINSDNIYLSDKMMLGECASQPPGFWQPAIYEPIARIQCSDYGKGEPTERSDMYAVGVLAYEMLFGLDKFRNLSNAQLLELLLQNGAYQLLTFGKEFNESFVDLFRGCFNDDPRERWGLDQLKAWLGGKRYNIIQPTVPRDGSRPFIFADREFYNLRSIAHSLHQRWRVAAKDVRGAKLDRWLEMSAHRVDMGDTVARIMRSYGGGGDGALSDRQTNEMLSRMICVLDPLGPIRNQDVSLTVDGLGAVIADAMRENKGMVMQRVMEIIEFDLPSTWAELLDMPRGGDTSRVLWRLQRLRLHLKNKSLGYGSERMLYDLNPILPCQSPMVLVRHVSTVKELLQYLDSIARSKAKTGTSLVDRHIAAFMASRAEINKEIRIADLTGLPELHNSQELLMLKLLSVAQDKSGRPKLIGLAAWAATRVEYLLSHVHNRRVRKKMKAKLQAAALSGMIGDVLDIILNFDMTSTDHAGFNRALDAYHKNAVKIDYLENPKSLQRIAKDLGGRISVVVGYLILAATCYVLLGDYMEW